MIGDDDDDDDKVVDVHVEEEDGKPLATVTRESGETGWGKGGTTQRAIDKAVQSSKK